MTGRALRIWFLIADAFWIVIAVAIVYAAPFGARLTADSISQFVDAYGFLALIAVLTWVALSLSTALDGFRGGWQLPNILCRMLIAVALMITVLAAARRLGGDYGPNYLLATFGIVAFAGIVGIRCAARGFFGSRFVAGAVRRVMIAGAARPVQQLADRIARHPEMLWHVVGYLHPGGFGDGTQRASSSVSGCSVRTFNVLELLRKNDVQELLVCMPDIASAECMKLAASCRRAGIAVTIVPVTEEPQGYRPRFRDLEGVPLVSMTARTAPAFYLVAKRAMDIILGTLLLVVASPLIIVTAAALRLRKGRAFRPETRCGLQGGWFQMYRFNVQRFSGDLESWEAMLDRLSVTELPQLWNVLKGEMSLVGPRPEDPERVKHYSDWQRQRLNMRPGVTGLAQVHGLRDDTPSERKLAYDVRYIAHWSPLGDLALVMQTIWTLITRLLSQPAGRDRTGPSRLKMVPEILDAHRAQSSPD